MIWDHLDRGTSARSCGSTARPTRLPRARRVASSATLTCPALVVWGQRDRYLPTRFGRAFAEALPGAELELVAGAGHWPWTTRQPSSDPADRGVPPGVIARATQNVNMR